MGKSYKILLFLGGFLAVLVLGAVLYSSWSGSKNENNPQDNDGTRSQQLPEYILGDQEERELAEFVKYFVNLYNSYGYGYTSNLSALGDDQTPDMQEKTLGLIESLNSSLPETFSQNTETDVATFSYKYPEANRIAATIKGKVVETSGNNSSVSPRSPALSKQYSVTAELDLQKLDGKWLVNNMVITKN